MLWTSSVKSKATGIALGTSSLGIHLHPALLVEARSDFLSSSSSSSMVYNHFPLTATSHRATGNSNTQHQQQLYIGQPCDAGTIVAVIPNTSVINLQNLRRRGALSSCIRNITANNAIGDNTDDGDDGVDGNDVADHVARFIGAPSSAHWKELAWRLALEISASSSTGHVSPWWYWIDSCKEEEVSVNVSGGNSSNDVDGEAEERELLADYHYLLREAEQEMKRKYPNLLATTSATGDDSLVSAAIGEMRVTFDRVYRNEVLRDGGSPVMAVVPNQRAWNLALDLIKNRSVMTFAEHDEPSASRQKSSYCPSIIPVADLCAHAAADPNVAITIIDSPDRQTTSLSLPDWVKEQQKRDVCLDIQDERARRDEERIDGATTGRQRRTSKGPRKPQSYTEKMEARMANAHVNGSHRSRSATHRSNGKSGSGFACDFYYALELTRDCRGGETLKMDWIELSPGQAMIDEIVGSSKSPEVGSKMANEARGFYSWTRFNVVPI